MVNFKGETGIVSRLAMLEQGDRKMIYYNHPAYGRAMRAGVEIAAQATNKENARVFYDPETDAMGACSHMNVRYSDERLETVAYCSRYDHATIWVREPGRQPQWVNV